MNNMGNMPDNIDINEERSFEFGDLIVKELSKPTAMMSFASKVLANAQEGDSTSLKMIQQALHDVKFRNEKRKILKDEQLKTIISLAADRLREQEQS